MGTVFAQLFAPVPDLPDLPAEFSRSLLKVPAGGRLTLREALAMYLICIDPGSTVTSIARLIGSPQPSATRCVQRLEKMGLIRRQARGRHNQRPLVPTIKGQRLIT